MVTRRPLRRGAVLAAATMGLSVTTVVAPAPASAAEGCLQDVPVTLVTLDGCDDTTPPETSIGATAPRITSNGWITKGTIRVGLKGTHTDADTGTIGFECHLSTDADPPTEAEWEECEDGEVFRDLAESAAKPYVLWARAVDTTDAAIAWSDGNPLNGVVDETGTDHDVTPATLTFRVDTVVPDTYVFDTPYDPITPQLPMVPTASPRFRLAATEAAAFRCTLNGGAVPCAAGSTTLRSLSPGDKTLRVQAVDPAGNADPSPAVTRFAVPANLKAKGKKPGWKRVRTSGYLGGDVLQARERGSELTFVAKNFRELRLIASTGPQAGKIQLKIGETWHKVDLRRATNTKSDQIQVLDEFSPRRSGKILVRVLSQGKRVSLDGVLAH